MFNAVHEEHIYYKRLNNKIRETCQLSLPNAQRTTKDYTKTHNHNDTAYSYIDFLNISYDAAEHVITKVPDFSSILHRLLSVASIFFSRVFLVLIL
jgi:hypothetical protein